MHNYASDASRKSRALISLPCKALNTGVSCLFNLEHQPDQRLVRGGIAIIASCRRASSAGKKLIRH
jgi:hypothetical protein